MGSAEGRGGGPAGLEPRIVQAWSQVSGLGRGRLPRDSLLTGRAELTPRVACQSPQIARVEIGQRRPQLIARVAVDAHSSGSTQAEKAGGEVLYESLDVEYGCGRVLVALVDVYVVTINKPLEIQLVRLGGLVVGTYLMTRLS